MATFNALNIESDEDSEEEVDESREIQIEEALKLYQNALKLHSQGPAYYRAADEAYKALFASEIFNYPEALSVVDQPDRFVDENEEDDDGSAIAEPAMPISGNDVVSNSLPQILYLSYKNYGQFWLDDLTHRLKAAQADPVSLNVNNYKYQIANIAWRFAQALERDDTDLDLWRKLSSICDKISSKRISRLCLESILDGDDDSQDPLNLETRLAKARLDVALSEIQDDLSQKQLQSQSKATVLSIPALLKSRMELASALPQLPKSSPGYGYENVPHFEQTFALSAFTWAEVGKCLLHRLDFNTLHPATNFGECFSFSHPYLAVNNNPNPVAADGAEQSSTKESIAPVALSLQLKSQSPSKTLFSERKEADDAMHTDTLDLTAPKSPDKQVDSQVRAEEPTADSSIHHTEDVVEALQDQQDDLASEAPRSASISLPTRKRTSESAGLPDPGDGGREKSRRIRARAEGAEEENAAVELFHSMNLQLQSYAYKDQQLFDHVNGCLSKLGRHSDYSLSLLKSAFSGPANPSHSIDTAIQDMRHTLTTWDHRRSILFAQGRSGVASNANSQTKESGLEMFLEYSRKPLSRSKNVLPLLEQEELISFLRRVNSGSLSLDVIAIAWVLELLCARTGCNDRDKELPGRTDTSFYLKSLWSENLKQTVVHMLVKWDEPLFSFLLEEARSNEERALAENTETEAELNGLTELLQAIFEIHLDVYGSITHPSSQVHHSTRGAQRHILKRWSQLTHDVMNRYQALHADRDIFKDPLQLRYVWAVVKHMSLSTEHSREYITLCYEDLRTRFLDAAIPKIELQNNAIMPELSLDAIDRELSTLRTMDFFLRMFDRERGNPISVIETLEPILLQFPLETLGKALDEPEQQLELIRDFLRKAGSSSRMLLWHKLRAAYEEINYSPLAFLCDLKVLQMLLEEFSASDYLEDTLESRAPKLVHLLHDIDSHLTKAVLMAVGDVSCFDCLDEDHLRLALETCETLIFLLHTVALWEDSVRVGQSALPPQSGLGSASAFENTLAKLRAMYVKAWLLQYTLLKEAIAQNRDAFPEWKEDLTDLLDLIHRTLGMRQYCNVSKKMFLHFARTELSALNSSEVSDMPMGQVVFDLYGFKVCSQTYLLEDHGCSADRVDKQATLEILDFVMKQSEGVQMKDLFKTEFKSAFENMQAAVGSPKQNAAQTLNGKLLNSYFKGPINPQDLYRCIKGIGSLPSRRVESFQATIASKRLFYVMGHITLAKFKSQKRVSPGSTADLDVAIALLEMDLKFDTEKWETWHRLGQAYDAKLEEDTLFKADKLNNNMPDLITLQRKAIKCYTMAVAIAMRGASAQPDTVSKLSELFTDFGLRIYASSRQPFSMQAFGLGDAVRHYNNELNTMYTKRPFREFQLQSAWSFAAELFRQSLLIKPQSWMNWYMLGKCLSKLRWMMGDPSDDIEIIAAFTKAVECVPDKRDSRHPEKDPILEPHYKLVSTIHKLVKDGALEPAEGCEYLQATFYARKVGFVDDREDWETYILSVLKSLRNADKSNWHHRFVARAAHVIYDDSIDELLAPYGAKHELTQQIFTKTMTIQVWRPEYERAGRHFVYTGRYVEFFVELLRKTNDRANIEALAKRIRKRASDFVDHGRIWDVVCVAYVDLLRRHCNVPLSHEDAIFKGMPYSRFQRQTAMLEEWAHGGNAEVGEHRLLEGLREAVELKKLNAGLKKDTLIDDLVGDIVARMYETIVPGLKTHTIEGDVEIISSDEESAAAVPTPFNIASQLGISAEEHAAKVKQLKEELRAKERLRQKVITRKEIQRRAEALVNKPILSAPLTSIPITNAAAPTPDTTDVQIVIPSQRSDQYSQPTHPQTPVVLSQTPGRDLDPNLDFELEPDPGKEESAPPKDVPSSVPGSVHDSADDESELTDIDEDEEEGLEGASRVEVPQPAGSGPAAEGGWWGARTASRPESDGVEPMAVVEKGGGEEEEEEGDDT